MGDDTDKPEPGEPFFSRWSRRKQSDKQKAAVVPAKAEAMPVADASARPSSAEPNAERAPADAGPVPPQKSQDGASKAPLTEADFADVDFSKLDYGSNYDRFLAKGVPEGIRQKALTQLWNSDTIFTQVDPFQDYAGDFTDAATVPIGGIVKTAYKVGQGFLSDDEAHTWDRLGKADVTPALAALPVLRPGYRWRQGTPDDATAMAALQTEAILSVGAVTYDEATAQSWAVGLDADLVAARLSAGGVALVAIAEDTGAVVALCGRDKNHIAALFVQPGHGRRGLARRLVAQTITALETPTATGAMTVAASRASQTLLRRLGFVGDQARLYETRGGGLLEVIDMSRPIVSSATLQIGPETPDQADVRAFFAASEAYMGALYPAESNHFVDAAALVKPDVIFLVARLNGAAVGCGAVVIGADGCGEIKRMWVEPGARGLQLGVRLLEALQVAARARGVTKLQLETGIHQPEAIGLYRRAGFVEIGPFGSYAPDPLSLFMEKRLEA